jgi:hypothetical protein
MPVKFQNASIADVKKVKDKSSELATLAPMFIYFPNTTSSSVPSSSERRVTTSLNLRRRFSRQLLRTSLLHLMFAQTGLSAKISRDLFVTNQIADRAGHLEVLRLSTTDFALPPAILRPSLHQRTPTHAAVVLYALSPWAAMEVSPVVHGTGSQRRVCQQELTGLTLEQDPPANHTLCSHAPITSTLLQEWSLAMI